MARVLPSEVKAIYDPGADEADLYPFIEVATLLVDEELLDQGLSANRLKQIELYLAAHFATVSIERGGLTRQRIGDAEEEYQGWGNNNSTGLTSTRFGQQALTLDPSGTLGALSERPVKAQFRVIRSST